MTQAPVKDSSPKTQRIRDMIKRGVPTKDIVESVATTPGNVWKEKSMLKAKGLLGPQQGGLLSSVSDDVTAKIH
jgi:hypothetical protein